MIIHVIIIIILLHLQEENFHPIREDQVTPMIKFPMIGCAYIQYVFAKGVCAC